MVVGTLADRVDSQCNKAERSETWPRVAAKVRILHFKYLRHSDRASVLITTFEIFTRVSPDNSLERLTERSIGLVTDRPSDVDELFVTLFKELHRLLHPPLGYVCQRCLSEEIFKTRCECGARHARRFGEGRDRPGCIHTVVNGTQSRAHLRIENRTKPSFVAFRS